MRLGSNHTDEAREAIAAAARGRTHTPRTRKAISGSLRRRHEKERSAMASIRSALHLMNRMLATGKDGGALYSAFLHLRVAAKELGISPGVLAPAPDDQRAVVGAVVRMTARISDETKNSNKRRAKPGGVGVNTPAGMRGVRPASAAVRGSSPRRGAPAIDLDQDAHDVTEGAAGLAPCPHPDCMRMGWKRADEPAFVCPEHRDQVKAPQPTRISPGGRVIEDPEIAAIDAQLKEVQDRKRELERERRRLMEGR